jgi:hypothetical protein
MKQNYYELTYIINPVLEEEDVKKKVEEVTSSLKANGAEIEEINEWGIQRLQRVGFACLDACEPSVFHCRCGPPAQNEHEVAPFCLMGDRFQRRGR